MPKMDQQAYLKLYASLGVNPDDLGCIMLDTEKIDISKYLPEGYEDDLFYSATKQFAQGDVAGTKAHVTLLYGLLQYGSVIRYQVDAVLEGWKQPKKVTIDHVGFFESSSDEDYSVIVAHIDPTPLIEANERLKMLPHIDTFPGYKAHLTLAYVKPGATTEFVEALSDLNGKTLTVATDLNYGK